MRKSLEYLNDRSNHDHNLSTLWPVFLPLICLFTSILFHTSLHAQSNEDPSAVVDELQSTLIDIMKEGPEILYAGRYDRLEPVIKNTHQITYIARLTVGRYWRDLSEEEKKLFVDKFSSVVVSRYASMFKKYKGEYFEFVSEENLQRGNVILISDLYWGNGVDSTRFNYVLRQFENNWQIVNILVKGVSDLALKRAEFTSIIEKEGFESLLVKLTEKVEEVRQKQEEEGT